jgi:selenide,water dikinase
MGRASGARLVIDATTLPALPGALALVAAGLETEGARHNRRFVAPTLERAGGVDESLGALALDPQTSGGLLAAIPADIEARVEADLETAGHACWRVGHVERGTGIALA